MPEIRNGMATHLEIWSQESRTRESRPRGGQMAESNESVGDANE
jgi:hypothetical protein